MRTTLDIDTEVLVAAKELAKREHKSAGQLVSELLRLALNTRAGTRGGNHQTPEVSDREFCGFKPFPSRGGVVTNQLVGELREEWGD